MGSIRAKCDRFAALREQYFATRSKLHPVLRAVYGGFDSAALAEHLAERVGRNFEILMVHSSINHMKPMYDDNPLQFVQMLIEFCGAERTLAMPAFYFGDLELGGMSATFEKNPRFDLRRTPSQMGPATEIFRRTRGVRQSRHPVYRACALGPLAEALTTGHETAESDCGRGSPFDLMTAHDTSSSYRQTLRGADPYPSCRRPDGQRLPSANVGGQPPPGDIDRREGGDPVHLAAPGLHLEAQHVEAARDYGAGRVAGMAVP